MASNYLLSPGAEYQPSYRGGESLAAENSQATTADTGRAQPAAANHELPGSAAPDLRSPLMVIAGYADLLFKDEATLNLLPETRQQALHAIHRVSDFMLRLLNDMLDLSVIESGRVELHPAPVELAALLHDSLAMHARAAATKNIALLFDPDSAPVTIIADSLKLRQAVDNLLSNAIKFSPPDTAISIGSSTQPGKTWIVVRDQGPGSPPADIDRLFQPFAPGGNSPTGGETSTGLGLVITRRIAAAHGGRVWAESAPGKSSTFTIELPVNGLAGRAAC